MTTKSWTLKRIYKNITYRLKHILWFISKWAIIAIIFKLILEL